MKRDLRKKRKKEEQNKRRFEAVKNLMSTFTMGTVAVVAAVVLIPQSPKAEITKALALEDEIVYQVNVTDQDNALDLDTLNVVLENQLEYYEQPINLGENTGYFESLNTDTQYRLSVYGNKGFGQERLDTVLITTEPKVGGTILFVDIEDNMYEPTYLVNLYINDPDVIYSSISLYYGYQEHYHYEEETTEEPEMFYTEILVTDPNQIIEIFDIYTQEPFHIYLEGTTEEGTVLLDEVWVTPPFSLYSSFYLEYVNNNEIGFSVYNDSSVDEMTYLVDVYKDDQLIKQETFVNQSLTYEGTTFSVDDLDAETSYLIICKARYINPQTLRSEEQIIYEEEITTLSDYSVTYEIEPFDEYMVVTITLIDPNNMFNNAHFNMFDTSDVYDMYLSGYSTSFEEIENKKVAVLTIYYNSEVDTKTVIAISSNLEYTHKEILEIIYREAE